MILVFDTETTGKADFKASLKSKHQPHIVQLGAQLIDEDWKVRGEINLIVRPEGWEIPAEASAIHGITTDIANRCGLEIRRVLSYFFDFVNGNKLVAHNFAFDKFMVDIELARMDATPIEKSKDYFCTMHATTQICKLPGQYGDYKWPKLIEAYQHLFGESFEGAHDAMADVRACARIYKWLKTDGAPVKGVEGVTGP